MDRDQFQTQMFSQDQYRLLVECVTDYAIYCLDTKGVITSWNAGAERIKGYKEEEVIGKNVSLFYEKGDILKKLPEQELALALKDGKYEGEGWRVKKDESLFYAKITVTPIFDNENKHIGFGKVTRDLTESKKAERSIVESEQRVKLLIQGVESVKDYAIFVLDENGFITTWNAGAERIIGYKEKEILGKHFSVFYPKEAVEAGYPDYELRKAGKDGRFEDEGIRIKKEGAIYWANVIITPIFNRENKIIGFSKVVKDLSERKNAEKTLLETEEKYRLLIEGVQDYAIFMLDQQGHVNTWNLGAERINGYRAEEIIGRHFSVFYPKKAIEEGFPEYELREAVVKGRFEDRGWRIRKDGSIFWVNAILTPLYNKDKRLIGFSKITRDLTEQKKTERLLRENEERFRLLLGSISDYAIFMLDTNGNISTWNTAAERIKGYKADEIIGRHFSVFYPEEAVNADFPAYELKRAKEEGRFEHEGWRIRKNGTRFWANVIINPIRNYEHKLIGFSKITRDLTERKKAENELERKNAELLKLNSDLDSFVYTASHDLKAPVANIEGLINILKNTVDDGCQEAEIRKLLLMMESSVKRFKETIYDIAEITKIQRDNFEQMERIAIGQVVEDTKASIQDLITANSATIRFNEPTCTSVPFVKSHLRSVFYNIISNAIKYRSEDRDPVVEIECTTEKEYTVILFRDNGIGIEEKHKEKIFQMFKRFNDTVPGTGVGLYIVKRIVDNAGGKIEVESEVRKGSVFKLYFKNDQNYF